MGDVWDRTVEFLGDHLGVLMPLALLAIFVPASITGSLSEIGAAATGGLALALGLASLVAALLQVWAQLAIAALAVDPPLGGRVTRLATARLLPMIGLSIVVLLLSLLLALPLLVAVGLAGADMAQMRGGTMPTMSGGFAATVFVVALATLAAWLALGARLMLVMPVVAVERRGLGAIRRSIALTRGLAWRIVGVILLYAIVMGVSVLAARTVFGSALRLFTDGDGPLTVAGIVTAVVVGAVTTGFAVLASAFTGKLYLAAASAHHDAAVGADAA